MLTRKPILPEGIPLIAIGYKYIAQKIIYFIVTERAEITKARLPYLSNYPGHISNVAICSVVCILVMYNFFGSVNEVYSQNKSRHSDLEMISSGFLDVVGYVYVWKLPRE